MAMILVWSILCGCVVATWNPQVTPSTTLPVPLEGGALAWGPDGTIWHVGGRSASGDPTTIVYRTVVGGGPWVPVSGMTLPIGLSDQMCATRSVSGVPSVVCVGGTLPNGNLSSEYVALGVGSLGTLYGWRLAGSAVVGGRWLVVGGETEMWGLRQVLGSRLAFTVDGRSPEGRWETTRTPGGLVGKGVMCASDVGTLYCCGGTSPTGTPTSACVRYVIETVTNPVWVSLPPLLEPRTRGCCSVVPGGTSLSRRLCCFGGEGTPGSLLSTIECLDLPSGTAWETLSVSLTPRRNLGCLIAPDGLHLVGGAGGSPPSPLSTHEVFVSRGGSVTPDCPYPTHPTHATQCVRPTYVVDPFWPTVGTPFTIYLPPYLTASGSSLRLSDSSDCRTVEGLPSSVPVTVLQPRTGSSSVAGPGSVVTADRTSRDTYVCLSALDGDWAPIGPPYNGTAAVNFVEVGPDGIGEEGLLGFPIVVMVDGYRVEGEAVVGFPIQVEVIGADRLDPERSSIRLVAAPGCRSTTSRGVLDVPPDPVFTSTGVPMEAGTDPSTVVGIFEVSQPGEWYVCLHDGAAWQSLPTLTVPGTEPTGNAGRLTVKPLETAARTAATVASSVVTAAAVAAVAANPAGSAQSIAEVQLMSMLGQLPCSSVGMKSVAAGTSWMLTPLKSLSISEDGTFNNVVFSLLGLLLLAGIHAMVVSVCFYRKADGWEPIEEEFLLMGQTRGPPLSYLQERLQATLRFPKIEILVLLLLFPGLTLSGLKLLSGNTVSSSTPKGVVIFVGICAFLGVALGFLAFLIAFVHLTLRRCQRLVVEGDDGKVVTWVPVGEDVPAVLAPYSHNALGIPVAPGLGFLPSWVLRWLPTHFWRSRGEFTSRFGVLFGTYDERNVGFTVLVLLRAVGTAVLVGLPGGWCLARGILIVIVMVAFGAAVLFRQPYRSQLDNALRPVVAFCQAAIAVCTIVESLHGVGLAVMMATSVLMTVDGAWLLLKAAYHWTTWKEVRRSEAQESEGGGPQNPLELQMVATPSSGDALVPTPGGSPVMTGSAVFLAFDEYPPSATVGREPSDVSEGSVVSGEDINSQHVITKGIVILPAAAPYAVP